MLLEVRDQLSRSGVVNSDLAIPLFDSLLRVALADVSSTAELPEEKPDRVSEMQRYLHTKKPPRNVHIGPKLFVGGNVSLSCHTSIAAIWLFGNSPSNPPHPGTEYRIGDERINNIHNNCFCSAFISHRMHIKVRFQSAPEP